MIRSFESAVWTLRRWLMATLVLGLAGTATELLLLEHYDEPWQWVPLLLVALAFGVLVWHWARRTAASVRALQITMLLFVVSSGVGLALHFRGAAQFQLEIDPAMPRSTLIAKVMRVKDPPVLAPGVMLQLGLIGLAYAYACQPRRASASEPAVNHKE
jgi:hypothetical protein